MPQPTSADVHANRPLTNISIAYLQSADMFIHNRVFPNVPVSKQSDSYWQYPKGDWHRDEARVLAPGDESAGSGFTLSSTRTYFCDVVAFHKDVPDQVVANEDEGLDSFRDASQFVTHRLLVKRESDWVTAYFSTNVWDTEDSTSTDWDTVTTSDPLDDIEGAKQTILQNTAREPNTLAVGYKVFRALKHHPDVVDRIKYTGGVNQDTLSALGSLVDLPRMYVAKSIKNTGAEGATDSFSFNVGFRNALVAFVNPSPGRLQPSAGYNFVWTAMPGGLGGELNIRRYRIPERHSERVEGITAYDFKVVGSDLGYFFQNIVSS